MSQWAEIRHLACVESVPKKAIARRLGVDVKTVRRALQRETAPVTRCSSPRGSRLDPWREEIVGWLQADRKVTAKRIRRLLEPLAGPVPARTVRAYVARVRREVFPKEAFVHRTHRPGQTMEVDFGEAWAEVAGRLHKCKVLIATLPHSNVYFAKAYPVERLECLLDGVLAAFTYFGGVPERLVLDNTALAVKQVLVGRERKETRDFHAFRGALALHVDFCGPRKGWEKGSVETGVKYVRNTAFRPRPQVASWAALNAQVLRELEADLKTRRLADGRPVREAWEAERSSLRPLPSAPVETCRTLSRVADKFGHVRVDRVRYSVPIRYAYQPLWVKLFHDRVELVAEDTVVARHARAFTEGAQVLDPWHVLPLLERKHRAVSEATALSGWALPPVFADLREALRAQTRKPDQEWIQVVRLLERHGTGAVEAAIVEALQRNSPRLETIALLLRHAHTPAAPVWPAAPVARAELATMQVAPPVLSVYDILTEGTP